eukprot:gb/GFBE01001629.1/.p1 GENE.gb/GFBE01001629.1/~~gb/GFBE01001629.1/.p1  ORF type:complete len:229 (+),score=37.88 gb/GFBE01001629.1/:1-687(+)
MSRTDPLYEPGHPWYGREPRLYVSFEHPYTASDFSDCLMGPVFENCGKVLPCHTTTNTTTHTATTITITTVTVTGTTVTTTSITATATQTTVSATTVTTTTVSGTTVTGTTVTATTISTTTMTITATATSTTLPPDCTAGLVADWSDVKKSWCCQHFSVGCPPTTTTTTPPPPMSCKLWGDPHIITFDGTQFVFYREGDFWIVKSKQILIQGGFQATQWTKDNDKRSE